MGEVPTTDWTELISRAAGVASARPDGRYASVAFLITGVVQGAVHASLGASEDGEARTRAFVAALVEEARRAGHVLRVVWSATTHGPHAGVEVNGCVLALESLALPRSITPLHITQTIDAARGTAEAAVLAITERLGLLAELSRAQLAELHQLPADVRSPFVRRAEAVQAGALAVLHELQFQDRASQMLAQAHEQAAEVIRLAGLQERELSHAALHQVGTLGRELGEAQASGSDVELF